MRLIREDGTAAEPSVRGNAVLATSAIGFSGASWTGPSGRRYVTWTMRPPEMGSAPPSHCPAALDPLPRDAETQARRAALMAVDRLYRYAKQAAVTAVRRPSGTPCDGALTSRLLEVSLRLVPAEARQRRSASLTQGRLLVGVVDGEPRVVYLLD